MWRNPNHPQPEPKAPPEPSGRPLAILERPGGRFGPPTELRVSLDEFEGNPYISVRLWSRGPNGDWFPTRKGCSIRIGEAEAVADALAEAVKLAHQAEARPTRAADRRGPRRDDGRQATPARRPATAGTTRGQAPPAYDQDFDEFG